MLGNSRFEGLNHQFWIQLVITKTIIGSDFLLAQMEKIKSIAE
jgi:hypothetical protein